nr:MAG TPA: hypothetical protein [Caudoviricetes sp.]
MECLQRPVRLILERISIGLLPKRKIHISVCVMIWSIK